MKVAIYTRFSSNNQTEMSTAAQVRACREFAEHSGMEIYKQFSISLYDRAAFGSACAALTVLRCAQEPEKGNNSHCSDDQRTCRDSTDLSDADHETD